MGSFEHDDPTSSNPTPRSPYLQMFDAIRSPLLSITLLLAHFTATKMFQFTALDLNATNYRESLAQDMMVAYFVP